MNDVLLVVVHTFKDQDGMGLVRIISARKASKSERKEYERRHP
jgi:uncharacterized DUF497 family protein